MKKIFAFIVLLSVTACTDTEEVTPLVETNHVEALVGASPFVGCGNYIEWDYDFIEDIVDLNDWQTIMNEWNRQLNCEVQSQGVICLPESESVTIDFSLSPGNNNSTNIDLLAFTLCENPCTLNGVEVRTISTMTISLQLEVLNRVKQAINEYLNSYSPSCVSPNSWIINSANIIADPIVDILCSDCDNTSPFYCGDCFYRYTYTINVNANCCFAVDENTPTDDGSVVGG